MRIYLKLNIDVHQLWSLNFVSFLPQYKLQNKVIQDFLTTNFFSKNILKKKSNSLNTYIKQRNLPIDFFF